MILFEIEMTPEIAATLTTLNKLHRNMWRPEIVNLLLEKGTLRFSEIQHELNITQKVLSAHLHWLIENHIVSRKVYPEVPPRVEYSLTEIGQQLLSVHEAMRVWAKYYVEQVNPTK